MAKSPVTANKSNPRILADKVTTKNGTQPAFTRQPKGADDKPEPTVVLSDKKHVKAPFTIKQNSKATESYIFNTTFDFSGCTEEDILILAMRSARIVFQGQLRQNWQSALHNEHTMVDVKSQIVDAERQQVDEHSRMIGLLARNLGISREDAEKRFAQMQQA